MSCSRAPLPVKMKLPKVGLAWGKGPVPARPPQRRRLLRRATVPSSRCARPWSAGARAQSITMPEESLRDPVWGCGGALRLGLWTVPTLHPSCHLRAFAGRTVSPSRHTQTGRGALEVLLTAAAAEGAASHVSRPPPGGLEESVSSSLLIPAVGNRRSHGTPRTPALRKISAPLKPEPGFQAQRGQRVPLTRFLLR